MSARLLLAPRSNDFYKYNPLIHRDRRLGRSASAWVRSFACEDLKPLIVCRGPIRKEAMDVYEEMGITHYGILLSEKDSIVYPNALAPELRQLTDNSRVHRVPDYTGASKEERVERIGQIIQIAKDNGYDAIFAGYGFMAEDEEFVAAIEKAGLKFIGPCSTTQAGAGKKDEAKRTALSVNVSVTPGVDNVTARTLVKKHPEPGNVAGAGRGRGSRLRCEDAKTTDSCPGRPGRSHPLCLLREGDRSLLHRRALRPGADRSRRALPQTSAQPLPPQGDRRRRRQGTAHPRRLAADREEIRRKR